MSKRSLARWQEERISAARRKDEKDLSPKNFVGYFSKLSKVLFVVTCFFAIGIGSLLTFFLREIPVGLLFLCLGCIELLYLPTYFSYRCHVDKELIRAEYLIICFKTAKEVLWKDVKYKSIKRNEKGLALSLRLYNANKKKVDSF